MNPQKIEVGTVTNYSVKGGFDAFGLSNVLDSGSSRGVPGWNYNQKLLNNLIQWLLDTLKKELLGL